MSGVPPYRPALSADSSAIATLWHSGWYDAHLGHVPPAMLRYRQLSDFQRRVPGNLAATTVAVVDGVIAGFVTVHRDEIEQLYVDAAHRGTVVAASLLAHGEQLISTMYDTAWLAVVEGNARARRFYERRGWSDRGDLEYAAPDVGTSGITLPARRYEKSFGQSLRRN